MYSVLIDSTKLFFINVFLYSLYLESYVFAILFERRFGVDLPFVTLFITGIFTFMVVTIWINIARVWYQKIDSVKAMLVRGVASELPFLLLVGIFVISSIVAPSPFGSVSEAKGLLVACIGYLILFPLIMVITKSHADKIEGM